jgi:hypothetical protein
MAITNLLRSGIHPRDRFKSWVTSALVRETAETESQNQGHAFGTCNVVATQRREAQGTGDPDHTRA